MSRLIDDIRAVHRFTRPRVVQNRFRNEWEKYSRSVWPMLEDPALTVVSINGVAIYYFETNPRERWDLGNRGHFADLTPPRPIMWFEYKVPRRLHSEEFGDQDFMAVKTCREPRAGALMLRMSPDDVKGENIPANAKWFIALDSFFDYGVKMWHEIQGPHGAWFLALDDAGQIIDRPWCQSFTGNNSVAQHAVKQGQAFMHPPLLALSWLPRELPEDRAVIEL